MRILRGRFQWPAWLLDWAWRRQATPGPDEMARRARRRARWGR